jgi:hypothetical protein
LRQLPDARFEEYLEAVPDEWKAASGSADQIIRYLIQARDNRVGIVAVIGGYCDESDIHIYGPALRP